MLQFLKRRFKSERGAMDNIMVTLLLVVIGVGAVIGISTWIGDQSDEVKTGAETQIDTVLSE
jgi:predicted MFS family arabinose efflux permease